jgi:hypothetical protein
MPSLYENPALYTAIVAMIALIPTALNATASLLPHLARWEKGRRLDSRIFDQLSIWHYFGNVNLGLQVSIRNRGGYAAFIPQIACAIQSDSGEARVLPAHYFGLEGWPNRLFNGVLLRPDEVWDGFVMCFEQFPPADRAELMACLLGIQTSLQSHLAAMAAGLIPQAQPEAPPAAVAPAITFFERHFHHLVPGEYRLAVAVSWDGGPPIIRGRRFTLDETMVDALRRMTDGYRRGQPGDGQPVTIELLEDNPRWARGLLY